LAIHTAEPATTDEVAEEWRRQVVSPLSWARADSQAGALQGECGGYFVTSEGLFRRRAYLKPIKRLDDHQERAVAAREKIASDLAYDLGLPVPPAVLVPHPGSPPLPGGAIVSLVMYPVQWAWEQVRFSNPSDDWLQALLTKVFAESSAGMLVFDTWLGQSDHDDHPHNVVLGSDPKNPTDVRLVYLDFARSLGCEGIWKNGAWKDVVQVPFPKRVGETVTDYAIRSAISNVLTLQEETIRDVVHRIPDDYLDPGQKLTIADGLIGRRGLLEAALV
jgi:hypothetical protein